MAKMTVNRENLIQTLELVQPGLSPREIIEQSSCFAFSDGIVMTFNDELSCSMETNLKFTGAVQAAPLLDLLRKLPETEVEVEDTKEELIIYGKRRSAGIRMEAEVTLPVENVERPKKWKDLHEEFLEAIKLVEQCVGADESLFALTCVHIHPKWVEAMDNTQLARYRLTTGFSEPMLVRGSSVKQVVELGVTQFSETETWVHFKSESGLVISCRRHLEEYRDCTPYLKIKNGHPLTLPKGLSEAADKADIFSKENSENVVTVTLRPGKLRLEGKGVSGWYQESKKIKYSGDTLEFIISPVLLQEIVRKHNECELTEDKLIVDGGKWKYVSCLSKA